MEKKPSYKRLAKVPLWLGMEMIGSQINEPMKAKRTQIGEYEVYLTSLRLRTFYRSGHICVRCGEPATHFAIEIQPRSGSEFPHMNMYGIKDGVEVLYTKDHVVSRKNGGKDVLDNMQTMCQPCNIAKGSDNVRYPATQMHVST